MLEIEHRDFRDTLTRCAERGGANLIVTSPPYLDSRARGQYGFACPPWTMEDYEALGRAVLAGLKPGGLCALNIFGRVARWRGKEFGTERSTHWMRVALLWQDLGLRYLECYAYARESTPGIFGPRHRSGFEPVHLLARPVADPYFDRKGVRLPARQAGRVQRSGANRGPDTDASGYRPGRHGPRGVTQTPDKDASTVIEVGTVQTGGDHPAAFDSRLADFFVLSYSAPGMLVCDPFVGSGTVAISAAKHGRQFVGGDLGERVEDPERGRIRARWADVARERMLAAVPAPVVPAEVAA